MAVTTSSPIQPALAQASAWGAISLRAKSRAMSRIMICSSVNFEVSCMAVFFF